MIKLKPSMFKSDPLTISESWIGCHAWMTRRSRVDGGTASLEVLRALLKPNNVVELTDAKVNACMPVDRPVIYRRSSLIIDLGFHGKARLFVSSDRQVAPIDESFVQLLELYELKSGPATVNKHGVVICQIPLVETEGGGEELEARTLVMAVSLTQENIAAVRMVAEAFGKSAS